MPKRSIQNWMRLNYRQGKFEEIPEWALEELKSGEVPKPAEKAPCVPCAEKQKAAEAKGEEYQKDCEDC